MTDLPAQLARCMHAVVLATTVALLPLPGSMAAAETSAEIAEKPVVPPNPARLPDGKPNWTGFWAPVGGMLEVNIGLGGTPPPPPPGAPPPPPPPQMPFVRYPDLLSPYKEQYDEIKKKMAAGVVADPVALCLPPGMPRMMMAPYGIEILQSPGQVAITGEWQAAMRRIWLYRDKHPDADELDLSYEGDSVGHWEGDTLVVDTVAIRNDVPLNYFGLMHSDKLHLVERFSETSPGILEDAFTIDDPAVFKATWQQSLSFRYRPDLHLQEYVCLENNRNVGAHGEAVFNK